MWLTRRLIGRLFYCLIAVVVAAGLARGQAPATTVIRDVVYRADGTPASGHVVISWPAFTTSEQRAVVAGSATVELGPGGAFEMSLAPNVNATPAGSYYRVVFQLDATSPSSETWSVPAVAQTTISAVRATVMPASAAVQVASRAYVDSALAAKAASGANTDITSLAVPLLLGTAPSPSLQLEGGKAVFSDAGQDHVALAVRAPAATHTADFFQVQDASSGDWPFFAVAPDKNAWFNTSGKGIVNGQGDVLVKSNAGNGNVQLTPNGTGAVIANGPLRAKGEPHYSVKAYGALGDGATDDTAAIQAALDAAVSAGGGTVFFPAGTYVVAGTIAKTTLDNIMLSGEGAILKGTSASGPILQLGDPTGATYSTHVRILGLTITNGAWSGGVAHAGDSTQDGIMLRTMKYGEVDVHAYELGGRAVVLAGAGSGQWEWGKVRVNSYDVGTPLYTFQANNVDAIVNSRRAHKNTAYLWTSAGIDLNVLSDETLQPSSPGTNDGVGVMVYATSWSYIHGTVVACKLEAIKVYGNSNWNRFVGTFGDSSTIANAYTANIVLDADATYTPGNNSFNVWAGYTGLQGTTNKPTYGIQSVASTNTVAIGLDATGVGTGAASAGVGIMGGYVGPTKQYYLNPSTGVYEIHGTAAYGFDVDTGNAGGTPTFKVQYHNGAGFMLYVNDAYAVIGPTTAASGTGRLRFTNNQLIGWRNAANSADLTAGYNASDVFAISASASIGGGAAIVKHLSATATLDFPNTTASNCSDLTVTVTGAATGDTVALGVPAGSVIAGGFFNAWVSAANTVTVRFCTLNNGNPASGTFRADVWKH